MWSAHSCYAFSNAADAALSTPVHKVVSTVPAPPVHSALHSHLTPTWNSKAHCVVNQASTSEGLAWRSVSEALGAESRELSSVCIAARPEGGSRISEGEGSVVVGRAPGSEGLTGSSDCDTFYSVSLTLNSERECRDKKQALSLLDSGVCENAKSEL